MRGGNDQGEGKRALGAIGSIGQADDLTKDTKEGGITIRDGYA